MNHRTTLKTEEKTQVFFLSGWHAWCSSSFLCVCPPCMPKWISSKLNDVTRFLLSFFRLLWPATSQAKMQEDSPWSLAALDDNRVISCSLAGCSEEQRLAHSDESVILDTSKARLMIWGSHLHGGLLSLHAEKSQDAAGRNHICSRIRAWACWTAISKIAYFVLPASRQYIISFLVRAYEPFVADHPVAPTWTQEPELITDLRWRLNSWSPLARRMCTIRTRSDFVCLQSRAWLLASTFLGVPYDGWLLLYWRDETCLWTSGPLRDKRLFGRFWDRFEALGSQSFDKLEETSSPHHQNIPVEFHPIQTDSKRSSGSPLPGCPTVPLCSSSRIARSPA